MEWATLLINHACICNSLFLEVEPKLLVRTTILKYRENIVRRLWDKQTRKTKYKWQNRTINYLFLPTDFIISGWSLLDERKQYPYVSSETDIYKCIIKLPMLSGLVVLQSNSMFFFAKLCTNLQIQIWPSKYQFAFPVVMVITSFVTCNWSNISSVKDGENVCHLVYCF